MVEEKRIPEGYKQTEVGVIPEDWKIVRLGDVCQYQNGRSLEKYFNNRMGYKVISIGNYSATGRYIENSCYISSKHSDDISKFILKRNDLTILLNDKTSIGTIIGRALFIEEGNKYVFNQRTMRLSFFNQYYSKFIYYMINSEDVHKIIMNKAKPGTQIYVNTNDILEVLIALPQNYDEQIRIAEVFDDTDNLLQSLQKLIDKKKKVKQGAMQELLTGKKRLPGFEGEWEERGLGDIAGIVMGQSPESKYYNLNSNGLPLFQGKADIKNRKSVINLFTSQLTKKCFKNDILMSVRAPVGYVSKADSEGCIGRGLCAIKPSNNYLYHYLIFIENSWSMLSTGSTFDSINSSELRKLKILMPSNESEQTAIATILSDMDTEIESLEKKYEKLQAVKKGMMQELLTGRVRLI